MAMSEKEREAFLADVHVGIISIEEAGRGPLTAPIWYDYEPGGELWVLTGPESRKGRLLRVGGRISLCAQTESPPYKYVSVEGPVTVIDKAETERDTRPMARRYLGEQLGDQYVEATRGTGESILVKMRPERWLSVDYSGQFST